MDIVMTTEFGKGSGWNRTKIGWCWGGMTVQGLLPYYYNRVSAANRTQMLDRCVYNSMADTPDCMCVFNQPISMHVDLAIDEQTASTGRTEKCPFHCVPEALGLLEAV